MFACLCLHVCLHVCLFVSFFVCLFASLLLCLLACLLACLLVCLFACLFACLLALFVTWFLMRAEEKACLLQVPALGWTQIVGFAGLVELNVAWPFLLELQPLEWFYLVPVPRRCLRFSELSFSYARVSFTWKLCSRDVSCLAFQGLLWILFGFLVPIQVWLSNQWGSFGVSICSLIDNFSDFIWKTLCNIECFALGTQSVGAKIRYMYQVLTCFTQEILVSPSWII